MKGITDRRSALAKALGGRIAFKRVKADKGRLARLDLAVRALPQAEVQGAMRAAVKHLVDEAGWSDEQLYTELGAGIHDTETQVQVLARCLVIPPADGETGETTAGACVSFVDTPDELRKLLEPDEVAYLFREFIRFQEERSPISRAHSAEEVVAYVDALGKGMIPTSQLKSCDNATLLDIACELAERLKISTRPSSWDTSPSSGLSEACSPSTDSTTETTETSPTSETAPEGMTLEVERSPQR